ncbi:hypothetical protein Tco_0418148 [Tanacetum coccineum]
MVPVVRLWWLLYPSSFVSFCLVLHRILSGWSGVSASENLLLGVRQSLIPMQSKQVQIQIDVDRCRAHNHTNTEMNESRQTTAETEQQQIQTKSSKEFRTAVDEEQQTNTY